MAQMMRDPESLDDSLESVNLAGRSSRLCFRAPPAPGDGLPGGVTPRRAL